MLKPCSADIEKVLVGKSSRTELHVLGSLTGVSCIHMVPHTGGDPVGLLQHRSPDVGRAAAKGSAFT